MKNSILTLIFLISTYLSHSQSVTKTMKRLPDTGQNTSYTATFGEDNDYTINAPFFKNNGNGTVTDTITGLMWQQTDGGEMTIENAVIYCDSLTLGGYTNWRLPDAHESFSILNHQNNGPALNTTVFTKTLAEYWWTGDKQYNDATRIWVINAGGGIGNHPKTETISAGGTKKFHVRAVRDVTFPSLVQSRLTKNGDGTVTDHLTGLIWEQIPNPNSNVWEQALIYAENLSIAGKTDWRLPNIKELQSLSDYKIGSPSIDNLFFTTILPNKYWSSTSLPNLTSKAWYLSTQFGITTYDDKTNTNYFICVRGGNQIIGGIGKTAKKVKSAYIFPNPATTGFYLSSEVENSDQLKFRLFNNLGQTVYIKEPVLNNNQFHFNTEALTNGLYFLTVKDNNTSFTYKFSIQK